MLEFGAKGAWKRNNGQRSFADERLTQCSKPAKNKKKPIIFNLFVQISGRIWTVVGRGYFSHTSSYRENVAFARRVNVRGCRFFLPTNKTFEGICLALAGKFLQKELWFLFVFKIIL